MMTDNIVTRMKEIRAEVADKLCQDMVLDDGRVMHAKEDGLAQVALYDDLIKALQERLQ